MTSLWTLPEAVAVGGSLRPIDPDFRTALRILSLLNRRSMPYWQRWFMALKLFYKELIPNGQAEQAMLAMVEFLRAGGMERPGPKLFDWDQDAQAILADVNRVAGFEVRSRPVHWWTFLSYFHAIGEGQLSTLVSIRDKLRRGKKLTDPEQEFYRQNWDRVQLR